MKRRNDFHNGDESSLKRRNDFHNGDESSLKRRNDFHNGDESSLKRRNDFRKSDTISLKGYHFQKVDRGKAEVSFLYRFPAIPVGIRKAREVIKKSNNDLKGCTYNYG